MSNKIVHRQDLIKIDENTYEIPQSFRPDMRVPARVFMDESLIDDVLRDSALIQLANVATLPGIKQYAFAMPDIHQGYGFPIGGVAAMAIEEGGVISPGGIGYDINCGVRLLSVRMQKREIRRYIEKIADKIYALIPSGVGRGGNLVFKGHDLDLILQKGAHRITELGFGQTRDLEFCEERGCMEVDDTTLISPEAKKRGQDQLGTLGSGNHFLEIQYVDEIFDPLIAQTYGLQEGQVTIMIHCGSRGLGHQTCTDYVRTMMQKIDTKNFADRELVCAPFKSDEGQHYWQAMRAAANFAWANRHMIAHFVREAFASISPAIEVNTVYDVSHNIGKIEQHTINNANLPLLVHRKGATRAFGPGSIEIPVKYQSVGQPVLIPGTMGTASYVLAGTEESMHKAFGSSCHGAGRRMSRMQAKKKVRGSQLRQTLEKNGILIRSDSDAGLAEEAPIAYKDVDDVVNVVSAAHLARKVARLKPIAVIKGD